VARVRNKRKRWQCRAAWLAECLGWGWPTGTGLSDWLAEWVGGSPATSL